MDVDKDGKIDLGYVTGYNTRGLGGHMDLINALGCKIDIGYGFGGNIDLGNVTFYNNRSWAARKTSDLGYVTITGGFGCKIDLGNTSVVGLQDRPRIYIGNGLDCKIYIGNVTFYNNRGLAAKYISDRPRGWAAILTSRIWLQDRHRIDLRYVTFYNCRDWAVRKTSGDGLCSKIDLGYGLGCKIHLGYGLGDNMDLGYVTFYNNRDWAARYTSGLGGDIHLGQGLDCKIDLGYVTFYNLGYMTFHKKTGIALQDRPRVCVILQYKGFDCKTDLGYLAFYNNRGLAAR
ncbi:hypothetical protein DPMN_111497 [Dreissena polymorpha]|uniref:Uncharacterized protein n=1 Tax=Dreissena polymorpha TaxID=45954 RepID=A0A9D4KF89_DREPO|nr:hypothetical protein DPMN_111497 [Dreissena polymorpha]